MKNKKYIVGGTVTGLAFGAVLLFNSFVFPSVLAASPGNSEIKTVPATTIEQDQLIEPVTDPTSDMAHLGIKNGVQEKTALKIAIHAFKGIKDVSNLPYSIHIADDYSPVDPIKWNIVFYDDNDGYNADINPYTGEVITLESFSGVKAKLSEDVEIAKKQKQELHDKYYKLIYSIYNK
ncbi:MAG: hypothetical protein ABF649_02405 [Bacillus sp. (in: firmicutes)]